MLYAYMPSLNYIQGVSKKRYPREANDLMRASNPLENNFWVERDRKLSQFGQKYQFCRDFKKFVKIDHINEVNWREFKGRIK